MTGRWHHRLSHPSYGVQKVYRAVVKAPIGRDVGARLRAGIDLDDGPVSVDAFRLIDQSGDQAQIELTIHVGRHRIVRRLMEEVGHPVRRLVRLQFGPIRLGRLRAGDVRRITGTELGVLLDEVDLSTQR